MACNYRSRINRNWLLDYSIADIFYVFWQRNLHLSNFKDSQFDFWDSKQTHNTAIFTASNQSFSNRTSPVWLHHVILSIFSCLAFAHPQQKIFVIPNRTDSIFLELHDALFSIFLCFAGTKFCRNAIFGLEDQSAKAKVFVQRSLLVFTSHFLLHSQIVLLVSETWMGWLPLHNFWRNKKRYRFWCLWISRHWAFRFLI